MHGTAGRAGAAAHGTRGASRAEERAEFARRIAGADYDDLPKTRLAYGTPDAATERPASLRDVSGFLLEPYVGGGIPRELVAKSVRLFAEHVAPTLHSQN